MNKIIKILFFAIVIGVCLPTILEADDIDSPPTGKVFYMLLANSVSAQYGIPAAVVKNVLKHESDYDPNAVGDHGKAHGIPQYHKGTFDQYEADYFRATGEHLNYASSEDEIKLMVWQWKYYPATKGLWSTFKTLYGGKHVV